MGTMLTLLASGSGAAMLIALTALYFSPWQAVWLAALSILTWRLPHWGAAFYLVAVSIDSARPLFDQIFVSYSELELAAVLLGWAGGRGLKGIDWRPLRWGLPFLGTVALSGLINAPWLKIPPHLLRSSELMVAATLTASVFSRDEGGRIFRLALASAAVFYSISGLIQFREAIVDRVFSFFENPNQFGAYLNLLLPFLLSLALLSGRRLTRLLWIYLAALALGAQFFTFSRGAMAGAAAATLTVVLILYKDSFRRTFQTPGIVSRQFLRRWGLILAGHFLVLSAAAIAVSENIDWRGLLEKPALSLSMRWNSTMGSDHSVDIRAAHMRLGWEMWRDHFLLGVGPGNYQETVERHRPIWESDPELAEQLKLAPLIAIHTHNLAIQLGVRFGLAGLLAFFYWIGRFFWQLLRTRPVTAWQLGGLGLLVAFFVHNLVDVTYPSLALETGLFLGLSLADANRREPFSQA